MVQGTVAVEEPVKVHTWRKVKYKEKPVYDAVKRAFDIVASVLALLLLSPLLIVVTILIFITDPGNPFFVQQRVGKNGKLFNMYKFRSMQKNAEDVKEQLLEQNEVDGPLFKITNDPRVTKVGAFIRKTSIDELPQLINILTGEMSVIGPRPFIPAEQAELPDERLMVKPGLSCYWQIGGKNSISLDEQMELDFKYIEERSVVTDLKIIGKTIKSVFKSDNY
ncbi:MAG: sugar transferase [Ruminococcus sp.]|nr:sugar transferase [Ruminococcus sp.]